MDRGRGQDFGLLLSGRWELSRTFAASARLREDKPAAAGEEGKKAGGGCRRRRAGPLQSGPGPAQSSDSLSLPDTGSPALLSTSTAPSPPTQQPLVGWPHFSLRPNELPEMPVRDASPAGAGAVGGSGVAHRWDDAVPVGPSRRFPPTPTPPGWPAHPMHPAPGSHLPLAP